MKRMKDCESVDEQNVWYNMVPLIGGKINFRIRVGHGHMDTLLNKIKSK